MANLGEIYGHGNDKAMFVVIEWGDSYSCMCNRRWGDIHLYIYIKYVMIGIGNGMGEFFREDYQPLLEW